MSTRAARRSPDQTTRNQAIKASMVPELLTYAETAKLLHLGPRQVRRLVLAGELKCIYVGTMSPRIDPASVLEFFERRVGLHPPT